MYVCYAYTADDTNWDIENITPKEKMKQIEPFQNVIPKELIIPIETFKIIPKELMISIETFKKYCL